MHKDLHYNGYTAQPSDYQSPDGDLALSLNLVNENGSLRPISRPPVVLRLHEPLRLTHIHRTYSFTHYILYNPLTNAVLWLDDKNIDADTKQPIEGKVQQLSVFPRNISIYGYNTIGNTIVVLTSEGMEYYLWKDGTYNSLGKRPPAVDIEFNLNEVLFTHLVKTDIAVSDSEQAAVFKWNNSWVRGSGGADGGSSTIGPTTGSIREAPEFFHALSNAVYGSLLSFVNENVTHKNRFYQPFFIRYAFRLYDGGYAWHSVPVLMIPTSTIPALRNPLLSQASVSGLGELDHLEIAVDFGRMKICDLEYRIMLTDKSRLTLWRDIVEGIDIFISAPIYTYEQSGEIKGYARNEHGITRSNGVEHKITLNLAGEDTYWGIEPREEDELTESLTSTALFYKVASLKFDELLTDIRTTGDTRWSSLPFEDEECLSNLLTRPTLPDDYNSNCTLIPSKSYVFNNRLNIADLKMRLAQSGPIRTMIQFQAPTNLAQAQLCVVTVRLRKSTGTSIVVSEERAGLTVTEIWEYSPDLLDSPDDMFPRYLFYPDPDAYEMTISCCHSRAASQETLHNYTVKLTRHPTLNGAYFFRGFSDDISMVEIATPSFIPGAQNDVIPLESKLYTSEVNNPFHFPLSGINTVGTGTILGISSAVKALSQGQFGQFPLYAFTTEGVWALEVSTTGTYIARQPVTRDVCTNPDSITQIDSAVLFATDRGVMLLSGSQTQCLTDIIDTDYPFDSDILPGFRQLDGVGELLPSIMPFRDFLNGCRMVYDYTHQRIILYNPAEDDGACNYAYVYSLQSKMWGMMQSDIRYGVNSYPQAMAIDSDGNLVDYSSEAGDASPRAILVTRPLKLDAPDIYKTIDTVIQRGGFRRGHVQSILYGSRDLQSWHLVWSSRDHFMRGFRGTPYKYFRIALLCDLAPDETLAGASIQYTPRLANRPR